MYRHFFYLAALAFMAMAPITCASSQHMNLPDAPCRDGGAMVEVSSCFVDALDQADKELNAFYGEIVKALDRRSDGGDVKQKLKKSELLWIRYRDAFCDGEHQLYFGGSAAGMAQDACLEALTRQQTMTLKGTYGWVVEKWSEE